jgi:hypothetical protein
MCSKNPKIKLATTEKPPSYAFVDVALIAAEKYGEYF